MPYGTTRYRPPRVKPPQGGLIIRIRPMQTTRTPNTRAFEGFAMGGYRRRQEVERWDSAVRHPRRLRS
jgi:hypothetical protein